MHRARVEDDALHRRAAQAAICKALPERDDVGSGDVPSSEYVVGRNLHRIDVELVQQADRLVQRTGRKSDVGNRQLRS